MRGSITRGFFRRDGVGHSKVSHHHILVRSRHASSRLLPLLPASTTPVSSSSLSSSSLFRRHSTKTAEAAGAAAAAAADVAAGEGSRPGTRAGIRPKGAPFAGRRGDSGRGWYKLYKEEGPEGFVRYRPPTPFDWSQAPANGVKRSKVYLEVSLDKEPLGKVVIELADDVLPMTAKNFALLCAGEGKGAKVGAGYKGSAFHRIVKDAGIVGGDLPAAPGDSGVAGNHSALGPRFFHDEGFIIPHTAPGLVSMVSAGVHRNGSHFYISTQACPHLNGRAVAFGRVVEGMEVVQKVASTYSIRGKPVASVKIENAGVV